MSVFRLIPSIDALLQRPGLGDAARQHGHDTVVRAVRRASDELRATLTRFDDANPGSTASISASVPASAADAADWIEVAALAALAERTRPSLRPVINATGVIVHTNLGRAPLADEALRRAYEVASGYSNLEYDLVAGRRGHRHTHAERLLCDLTGAEAALVTNNNAAATMLVLAALADGREVIVSRGELVEIGGGFRVPDVMAQSGAVLREVGTTNRTRVNDYAAAITDRTGLVLRVHPSNFRIEGFTERTSLDDLAGLGQRFGLPVFEDLGSGWLGLGDIPTPKALVDEPSVIASLRAGASLVAFSGDKLLGGPQAGIVVGERKWIDSARRHPLMRAVRADKVTYAALEATLGLWARPARRLEIPVYRMLTMGVDAIESRARAMAATLASVPGLTVDVGGGVSTTGGGSAPSSALPTCLVRLSARDVSAAAIEMRLRGQPAPVVVRIEHDRVLIDLRTVADAEDATLAAAIASALAPDSTPNALF